MELDEKFNLLRTLTQKIRSYDKHLIDTVTFCNNKMSSIVYDYYPFEVEIRNNNLYFYILTIKYRYFQYYNTFCCIFNKLWYIF